MKILGFTKTTLLDYPRHVAATVFTGGCNFFCPFCHNKDLVLCPALCPEIPESEILSYLNKRIGILEGVCITGGEPTLHRDLPDFIGRVREMGFKVKLDTNGYQPAVLRSLTDQKLLDYVAMDIKNSPDKYSMTSGKSALHLDLIQESIDLLINGALPFEFRTTVVRELHSLEDMISIGRWIKGAPAYYLQNYVENEQVLSTGFSSYTGAELLEIKDALLKYVPSVELRGVEA